MKRCLIFTSVLASAILLLPAIPVGVRGSDNADHAPDSAAISQDETASQQVYRVLDVSSGEVLDVPVREYVIGAVCAEMPAQFGEEALKAQAVAAHTYAQRQKMLSEQSPDPSLKGADFSNDTSRFQGYFTEEQAQQFMGSRFGEDYSKICSCVDEVLPYILTYEDEPIISAFHSMSAGVTESAENAWGTAVDYLVPVDSEGDENAPKYRDEATFSKDELSALLIAAFGDISLPEDIGEWVKIGEVSPSGTVLTAQVCGKTVSGSDIRSALDLRSACFEVSAGEDSVTFTTRGFGHCVGMSQYGANSMAQQGKSWQEILAHYYPNTTIMRNS
ncbi:MAG: stage II sporulation protein D [Ruminococcus sp.]|nr:stage II sporulation protein D [Ruminococcus sp.]